MKKIALLLALLVLVASLCACGGKNSPEKMLEQSQELNWETIEKAILDNKAKAIEDYEYCFRKLYDYVDYF